MENLKKPFFVESSDGNFFLYHPDTEKVVGQYANEEEMQKKSLHFFGEEAERRK